MSCPIPSRTRSSRAGNELCGASTSGDVHERVTVAVQHHRRHGQLGQPLGAVDPDARTATIWRDGAVGVIGAVDQRSRPRTGCGLVEHVRAADEASQLHCRVDPLLAGVLGVTMVAASIRGAPGSGRADVGLTRGRVDRREASGHDPGCSIAIVWAIIPPIDAPDDVCRTRGRGGRAGRCASAAMSLTACRRLDRLARRRSPANAPIGSTAHAVQMRGAGRRRGCRYRTTWRPRAAISFAAARLVGTRHCAPRPEYQQHRRVVSGITEGVEVDLEVVDHASSASGQCSPARTDRSSGRRTPSPPIDRADRPEVVVEHDAGRRARPATGRTAGRPSSRRCAPPHASTAAASEQPTRHRLRTQSSGVATPPASVPPPSAASHRRRPRCTVVASAIESVVAARRPDAAAAVTRDHLGRDVHQVGDQADGEQRLGQRHTDGPGSRGDDGALRVPAVRESRGAGAGRRARAPAPAVGVAVADAHHDAAPDQVARSTRRPRRAPAPGSPAPPGPRRAARSSTPRSGASRCCGVVRAPPARRQEGTLEVRRQDRGTRAEGPLEHLGQRRQRVAGARRATGSGRSAATAVTPRAASAAATHPVAVARPADRAGRRRRTPLTCRSTSPGPPTPDPLRPPRPTDDAR